jgi:hypothetical protein
MQECWCWYRTVQTQSHNRPGEKGSTGAKDEGIDRRGELPLSDLAGQRSGSTWAKAPQRMVGFELLGLGESISVPRSFAPFGHFPFPPGSGCSRCCARGRRPWLAGFVARACSSGRGCTRDSGPMRRGE